MSPFYRLIIIYLAETAINYIYFPMVYNSRKNPSKKVLIQKHIEYATELIIERIWFKYGWCVRTDVKTGGILQCLFGAGNFTENSSAATATTESA